MPGDTLNNQIIEDSIQATNLEAIKQASCLKEIDAENLRYYIFFWVLILFFGFVLSSIIFRKRILRWKKRRSIQIGLAELPAKAAGYTNLLVKYNSYFRSLNPRLRARFLERMEEFMRTKNFDYLNITAEGRMPVLVSAAAIQISFGLEKYLFDAFDTIHILQHDYQYAGYSRPFMGHVNFTGIYLSWDNFLKGYENDTDANNVGIHEMAHALAYVNFMAEKNEGIDDVFQQRFQTFSSIARPIFESMQSGASNMLDNYAATNYNEFWAVAMENFFEKPAEMKESLPELYRAMVYLLNQDPLTPYKILDI